MKEPEAKKPRVPKISSAAWLASLRQNLVCAEFHKYVGVAVQYADNTDTAALIAAILTLADELHAIDFTLGSKG